jgi:hypothetical protein
MDFLKPSTEYVSKKEANKRMEICNGCEFLKLKFCKQCGCFMPAKTKLKDAECPIKKW